MDLDFDIFESEGLITEVEKRLALYNRLITNVLWAQEKEPRYAFLFLSKVPVNEPPPVSPTAPLWRELLVYGAFFTYLSNSP
jgi:hypothetical protein